MNREIKILARTGLSIIKKLTVLIIKNGIKKIKGIK